MIFLWICHLVLSLEEEGFERKLTKVFRRLCKKQLAITDPLLSL